MPRLSAWWIALYAFSVVWLLLLFSLDASHFGPGFFPLLISIVLVPLLALVFLGDLVMRIADAVRGAGSSWPRRWLPVLVARIACAGYAFVTILIWSR